MHHLCTTHAPTHPYVLPPLQKAQEASAKDSEKMGKAFERAKSNVGTSVAQLAADNADAAAESSAQAAAALQQVSRSPNEVLA